MFRDSKSEMDVTKMGCGSLMSFGHGSEYLIVALNSREVSLVHTGTFQRVNNAVVVVEDVNFLSSNEVRNLHDLIKDNTTFSDYSFDPKSYKEK